MPPSRDFNKPGRRRGKKAKPKRTRSTPQLLNVYLSLDSEVMRPHGWTTPRCWHWSRDMRLKHSGKVMKARGYSNKRLSMPRAVDRWVTSERLAGRTSAHKCRTRIRRFRD